MTAIDLPRPASTVARGEDTTVFVALELSRKSWLVATSAPGESKISKRTMAAGDGAGLLVLLAELRDRSDKRIGRQVCVVSIQEAGLDGFWLHRLLEANGIESQVVDPASIAVDRRKRRRKTDAIDVEALLRTLMSWARGERRARPVAACCNVTQQRVEHSARLPYMSLRRRSSRHTGRCSWPSISLASASHRA